MGAQGIGALDAAAGLFADRGFVVVGIDLVKISGPLGGGALGWRSAGDERPRLARRGRIVCRVHGSGCRPYLSACGRVGLTRFCKTLRRVCAHARMG